jgi:dTDP-4-dehydrorhamnose 3,5-epimerase
MAAIEIEGVLLTPLNIINTPLGAVMHALKSGDSGFCGFGEAYFSTVNCGAVKGWKKHRSMTLNLVVPEGEIQFAIYDDRPESRSFGKCADVILSPQNYSRLTIPPLLWVAFKGLSQHNLLLNVASIKHDPAEAESLPIDSEQIPYVWR